MKTKTTTQLERGGELPQRIPPHNLEAEQSILGGLLIDSGSIDRIIDIINPADFYKDVHKEIYNVMLDLYKDNVVIDLITVNSLAKDKKILEKIGGVTYLNQLVDLMPSSANITQYAELVKAKALVRAMIDAGIKICSEGYNIETRADDYIDKCENLVLQVAENRSKQTIFHIKEAIKQEVETTERLYHKKQTILGISTGFEELDKLTSGLLPSNLIVVAGRPSMGKTAFCLNIVVHAAKNSVPVCMFSMEMAKDALVKRLLSREARIDHSELRIGNLKDADWKRYSNAAIAIGETPIFIDDSPALSVFSLRSRTRRLKKDTQYWFNYN